MLTTLAHHAAKVRKVLLFLFSHRFLAIARWDLHFLTLRLWNLVSGQRVRISRRLAARPRPLFLNLGSGPRGLRDDQWINVDGFKDRNVEFLLDISRRLPFPDATFDGVFCEHVIEHFSLEDGEKIVSEVYRMLALGGRLRIVVPDAEMAMRRYFDSPDALVAYRATGTAMEAVNSIFRQRYEHQFLYDWPTMEQMLLRAGFYAVGRAAFGRSECTALMLDDPKYEWESLYVEAVKTGGVDTVHGENWLEPSPVPRGKSRSA